MVSATLASSSYNGLPVACESTPLIPNSTETLSSSKRTFVNIVISIVGASVLSLPYTFKCVGWATGVMILAITAMATYYSMMLLVWSKRKLEVKGSSTIKSYGDLGFHTFGKPGRAAVDLLVAISQAGFCIGYLIFIGDTLASILARSQSHGPMSESLSQKASAVSYVWERRPFYVWIAFPGQVALSAIRSVTHLAPFSLFADAADVLAMAAVMVQEIFTLKFHGFSDAMAFKALSNVPFAVGVSIYAFEGISMVFPLETAMKRSHDFGRVMGSAILFITCIYSSFGLLGYLAYGEGAEQIITQNLGRSTEALLVKLALCFGLFFTFPVMMNPVYEVVERRFMKRDPCFWLRALIVLITCIVGAAVPNFTDYLSLAGSSFCSLLGFLFPASMYLIVFGRDCPWFFAILNGLLIIFGAVFAVAGTINSLAKMI